MWSARSPQARRTWSGQSIKKGGTSMNLSSGPPPMSKSSSAAACPRSLQARRDLDEMFALKKHGRRIVDGLLIIEEVELRGMNGKAAGA